MMAFKWAGVLAATLTIGLLTLANVLVVVLTQYWVPSVVNVFGVGLAAAGIGIAFAAHVYERISTKLDAMMDQVVGRLENLEGRVGDHNTGFVEGYLLNQGYEASVVPISPHLSRRGGESLR
jgi:hypothetical protein